MGLGYSETRAILRLRTINVDSTKLPQYGTSLMQTFVWETAINILHFYPGNCCLPSCPDRSASHQWETRSSSLPRRCLRGVVFPPSDSPKNACLGDYCTVMIVQTNFETIWLIQTFIWKLLFAKVEYSDTKNCLKIDWNTIMMCSVFALLC